MGQMGHWDRKGNMMIIFSKRPAKDEQYNAFDVLHPERGWVRYTIARVFARRGVNYVSVIDDDDNAYLRELVIDANSVKVYNQWHGTN